MSILAALLMDGSASGHPVDDQQANPNARTIGIYAYSPAQWDEELLAEADIVVVRYRFGITPPSRVQAIRMLAAQGKRVILDMQFMTTREQRKEHEPLPALRNVRDLAIDLLDQLGDVPLEGVTFDEENLASDSRGGYLAGLYNELKPRYPQRAFMQWLWIGKGWKRRARLIESLPADGYVIDPYTLSRRQYADFATWIEQLKRPVYSVVWASPGWRPAGERRSEPQQDWWNNTRWLRFHNRLAVNQSFNFHTILTAYSLQNGRLSLLWNGSDCDRRFAADLFTRTIPHYRSNPIPAQSPATRPAWIPEYCE